MVPTTSVNQSITPVGVDATGALQPETGGADFLDFLMGLESFQAPQAQSDSMMEDLTSIPGSKKRTGEEEAGEQAMLALFGQGASKWNALSETTETNVQPSESELASADALSMRDAKLDAEIRASRLAEGGAAYHSEATAQWLEATPHETPIATKTAAAKYATTNVERTPDTELQGGAGTPAVQAGSTAIEQGPEKSAKRESSSMKPVSELERRRSGDIQSDRGASSLDGSTFSLSAKDGLQATVIRPGASAATSTVPELFERVESMVQQGGGSMIVKLSPPDLGQVEIHVTARGKKVEIEMLPDSAEAKSALESKLGDLRSSLQSQDLVLSKMEVHVSRETAPQPDINFSMQGESRPFQQTLSQGNHDSSRDRGHASQSSLNSDRMSTRIEQVSGPTTVSRHAGRVDLRI